MSIAKARIQDGPRRKKRRMVKAFSHRQMEDDDVIIPNTYKRVYGAFYGVSHYPGPDLRPGGLYVLVLPAVENRPEPPA